MNHLHHPKFLACKLSSQKMTVTAFPVIILQLAVGLGMDVIWLKNMHALSYQS